MENFSDLPAILADLPNAMLHEKMFRCGTLQVNDITLSLAMFFTNKCLATTKSYIFPYSSLKQAKVRSLQRSNGRNISPVNFANAGKQLSIQEITQLTFAFQKTCSSIPSLCQFRNRTTVCFRSFSRSSRPKSVYNCDQWILAKAERYTSCKTP